MKTCYIEKKFQKKTLAIIDQANEIIDEYLEEGLRLTLRQLYYQFVARGLIANKQAEYGKLGAIVSDARLAGLIDWDAIVDRTRRRISNSHWSDPGSVIRSARYSFQLDHWKGQPHRVEVWIEKEALVGVISGICRRLDVPYFACKGYVSQSKMWEAAKRFRSYLIHDNQEPVIIHLGDHDPSGIDMTRDINDRNITFMADVEVNRIALNMNQVEEYNPPPNPAKLSDTRASSYISHYGNESWELDALDPKTLRDLIEETVLQYRDDDVYQAVKQKEKDYIKILKHVEENWRTLL